MSIIENKVFLLLLESPEQYNSYKDKKESFESYELVVCCLSVAATDYCKKNGINFILPEDCYTKEESEYYRKLSEKKIKSLVKNLNDYYHKKIGNIDGFLFDMGSYHFFMLYHFFGALHHRAFFLKKVIEKYKVDRILILQEPESITSRQFPVSQYTNCYLNLFQNSIYREKIICIPVQSKTVRQYVTLKIRIRSSLSKFLRKFKIINDYLNCVRNNIPVNFFRLLLGKVKSDVLLIGSAYNWKYVVSYSRITNRVSVFNETDEINLPSNMVKNWFKEWFDWEDKFCGFTVSALGYYEMTRVKILSEEIFATHENAIKIIKQKKSLIYSVAPYATQQYYLSIAKYLDIPRICFQHGQMSTYEGGLWNEASELLYISHYFSFGEQVSVEKTNRAKSIVGFEKAISIGSPALDNIKKTTLLGKEYILYASSKYLNYGAGFVPRYIDIAVKSSQNMLINYFEQYLDLNPHSEVIWKLNQERLTEQPSIATKNIKVINDEINFSDLIPNAQIIILDRPSTTSLEACMTNKPLFVLLSGRNWYSLPENLLRKRAVISYTPEELCETVDEYLTKGVYSADVNNKEYVKAYGCYLDDGLSSKRAVDELLKIIEENTFE